MKETIVRIKPLDLEKWHGKHGQESFAQPKGLEVLYDSATGKYATGLTDEEAEKYGKLLGVNLSNVFNPNEPHPYWSTQAAKIKLPNKLMVLHIDRPQDYVKWKNLLANKRVANSLHDYNMGRYPDATHYIEDEQAEVAEKANKFQQIQAAHKLAAKMSNDQKAAIVRIIMDVPVNKNSSDFIDVKLGEIFEDKAMLAKFVTYANIDKKELTLRAQLLDCIYRNILTKEGSSIHYMGDQIGFDFEDTVKYFLDPQNQSLKIAILEKLG